MSTLLELREAVNAAMARQDWSEYRRLDALLNEAISAEFERLHQELLRLCGDGVK